MPATCVEMNGTHAGKSPHFDIGDTVLCYHGTVLYDAKIMKVDMVEGEEVLYFVHYQGWKKKWDEWVFESRLLEINKANNKKAKLLMKNAKEGQKGLRMASPPSSDGHVSETSNPVLTSRGLGKVAGKRRATTETVSTSGDLEQDLTSSSDVHSPHDDGVMKSPMHVNGQSSCESGRRIRKQRHLDDYITHWPTRNAGKHRRLSSAHPSNVDSSGESLPPAKHNALKMRFSRSSCNGSEYSAIMSSATDSESDVNHVNGTGASNRTDDRLHMSPLSSIDDESDARGSRSSPAKHSPNRRFRKISVGESADDGTDVDVSNVAFAAPKEEPGKELRSFQVDGESDLLVYAYDTDTANDINAGESLLADFEPQLPFDEIIGILPEPEQFVEVATCSAREDESRHHESLRNAEAKSTMNDSEADAFAASIICGFKHATDRSSFACSKSPSVDRKPFMPSGEQKSETSTPALEEQQDKSFADDVQSPAAWPAFLKRGRGRPPKPGSAKYFELLALAQSAEAPSDASSSVDRGVKQIQRNLSSPEKTKKEVEDVLPEKRKRGRPKGWRKIGGLKTTFLSVTPKSTGKNVSPITIKKPKVDELDLPSTSDAFTVSHKKKKKKKTSSSIDQEPLALASCSGKASKLKPRKGIMTGYNLYFKDEVKKVQQPSGEDATVKQIDELSKEVSRRWREEVTEQEKLHWQDLAYKHNLERGLIGKKDKKPSDKGEKSPLTKVKSSVTAVERALHWLPQVRMKNRKPSPTRQFYPNFDAAAGQIRLLANTMTLFGEQLKSNENAEALTDLSVQALLDAFLCSLGPLLSLTQAVDELQGSPSFEVLEELSDNCAYFTPL